MVGQAIGLIQAWQTVRRARNADVLSTRGIVPTCRLLMNYVDYCKDTYIPKHNSKTFAAK